MLIDTHAHLYWKDYAQDFDEVIQRSLDADITTIINVGVDGTRYVLLSSFPFGEDGNFSWKQFDRLYNANLANGLGNLVARIAKLCEQNNIKVTDGSNVWCADLEKYMEGFKFNEAIAVIWKLITEANKKVNLEKPWELEDEKAKIVLEDLVKRIQAIAFNLQPFLPQTAEKILKQFSGEIKSGSPLFPRI